MWLQRLTTYLLQHRWHALLLTVVSTFIPVIGVVGVLIAAFMTLLEGMVPGFVFMLAATLPYLVSLLGHHTDIPLVIWAAVGVAVSSNVLTWVFAVMLIRQVTWSQLVQIAALFGVLVISVVHLLDPQVADWWGLQLHAYYEQATVIAKSTGAAMLGTPESRLEAISITKLYATGLMTAGLITNAMFQLVVARWWQSTIFTPGSLHRELHQIRLSRLAALLFVVSLVLSYLGNSVVLDIMPVVYVLFGVAGLSLIHFLFGLMKSTTKWFWISALYVTLIIAMPTSMVLLAMIAWLDVWLDIRKRFK
jgi:hypothetical protein